MDRASFILAQSGHVRILTSATETGDEEKLARAPGLSRRFD